MSQLESELSSVRKLLPDAVEKIDDFEQAIEVVNETIDLDNDIENTIVHKHGRKGLMKKVMRTAMKSLSLKSETSVLLDRIEDLKDKLSKMQKKKATRGGQRSDAAEVEWQHRLMSSSDVETDKVVGFDQHKTKVIDMLRGGNQSRDVVSIVGMGGLGKSTLARLIYHDFRSQFNCFAWVYVSNNPRLRDVWLTLLGCLGYKPQEAESRDDQKLQNMVQKHLKDKKYLIILDDVWNIDVWNKVVEAFPDDNKGSRILITSRITSVALNVSTTSPYFLQLLNQEDSWKLFCHTLWREDGCPPGLEPLGRRIVQGCKGLPLSIVLLARLLRNKEKSEREWSKFVGNVNWYLTHSDNNLLKDIIKLSYDNLPHQMLKICFLYLGIFPQGFEIPFRQLVHLWMAEGFCYPGSEAQKPEDIAEAYFNKLVDHGLILVAKRRTDGGVKTCQIHDLLHDFCIEEGHNDKLFQVYIDGDMIADAEDESTRISIHCSAPSNMSSSPRDHSSISSFLCFSQWYNFDESDLKRLLREFRLLRVLDLGQVQGMSSVPKNLEKSNYLRYLRIDTTEQGSPLNIDAICSLLNLETLDLRSSPISALPKGFHKLGRLRHLYMGGDVTLPDRSESAAEVMRNIQTLSTVALNEKNVSQMEKGTFPNLKKLGLNSSHETNLGLLQRLQCLSHLTTLKITNVSGFATSGNGRCMSTLGSLPNLKILKLSGMENSNNLKLENSFDLKCAAEDFKVLEVFQIKNMNCGNWELAQGAMPRLRRFVIEKCANMTSLPRGLWSLPDFEKGVVNWPSSKMHDHLQELKMNGEDRLEINHPPAGEEKRELKVKGKTKLETNHPPAAEEKQELQMKGKAKLEINHPPAGENGEISETSTN